LTGNDLKTETSENVIRLLPTTKIPDGFLVTPVCDASSNAKHCFWSKTNSFVHEQEFSRIPPSCLFTAFEPRYSLEGVRLCDAEKLLFHWYASDKQIPILMSTLVDSVDTSSHIKLTAYGRK
jgi:hypothetical protein